MRQGARPGWKRWLLRLCLAYLVVGFAFSAAQNAWAALRGGPSAFVWAGSWKGTLLLLFWWFVMPALIWPYELFWVVYHRLMPPR